MEIVTSCLERMTGRSEDCAVTYSQKDLAKSGIKVPCRDLNHPKFPPCLQISLITGVSNKLVMCKHCLILNIPVVLSAG